MKSKVFLVSFAILALVFALNTVLAIETGPFVSIQEVQINDIIASATGVTVAGEVLRTIPVEVEFEANRDASDVRLKVYIEGYRDDISESTDRFHILEGSTYKERFSIKLPSSMDLDDLDEDLTVTVRISSKDEAAVEQEYTVRMQRDLYSLSILSVDAPSQVTAGSTVALDVVLENNGNERLDNTYVRASIPELGVERIVYFGDLSPTVDENYEEIVDATNKKLYITIPKNAKAGVYNLEIGAYNYDTKTTVVKKIAVGSVETGVLPSTASKTVAIGEEATFDLVLVNPSDRMVVYSVTPEAAKGLLITVSEPVVSVPADSSRTIQVKVKATESAEEGTQAVTVSIASDGNAVKQASFNLNVEKAGSTTIGKSNTVLILTVILSIIFVVLLIVLIVLLTKKPAETEEFGETSYY